MSGWYNPLPIGQSATNPTGEVGRYAWEVGGLWFFRLPGQCGVIALPRTAHRTLLHESPFLLLHTTSSPLFSQLAFVISRVRYFSRSLFLAFFIAHPPTLANPNCAPIATSGNIGGNDLPWQGQRLPCTASDSGIRYAFGAGHMCILFGPYSILGFPWVLFPLLLAKFS